MIIATMPPRRTLSIMPAHFKVCDDFKGVFYIHAVSTDEQKVMAVQSEKFRNIMPNATINRVTYDNTTLPELIAVLTQTEFQGMEQVHLLITSGLVKDENRAIHSTDLVSVFKQAGVAHHATNFANLATDVSISMQCAKAILGLD